MKITTTPKRVTVQADSLNAVQRWLSSAPRLWKGDSSTSNPKEQSWDLSAGYEGAMELCRMGWSEGSKTMRLIFDALPRSQGSAMVVKYNPVRGRFAMGRYVTGSPNCFKVRKREDSDKQQPIVRLAVNVGTPFHTKAECMHNYGAAVAAAVEALEASGTRVEVTSNYSCETMSGKLISLAWVVKEAGGTLDMAALAFSVAHPAAFRRVMFAMMERTPRAYECEGYGFPKDVREIDLIDAPEQTIIVNASRNAGSTCNTPARAVATVQATINAAIAAWQADH